MCRFLTATKERCVVFAQWPSLVQFLAGELEAAGVKARALAGQTKTLENALRAFESGEVAVIVVPYECCAGLTLTSAAHLILYHGTSQQALVEAALRCVQRPGQTTKLTVHRMLAKATLEPSLHRMMVEDECISRRFVQVGS